VLKYVIKRLVYAFATLLLLITVTFALMHMLPGDPFTGDKKIDPYILKQMKIKYGLDKPIYIQYSNYIGNLIKLDLGVSLKYKNRTVNNIIRESFLYSFDLGLRALIFAVIAGIFLGVVASVNRGKKLDSLAIFIAVIGVSVPSFILGSLIQYFVGYKFSEFLMFKFHLGYRFFPVSGWDTSWHKILPPFALGLGALASVSRLMRSSMLDVLNQDYIKTAKAKGLSEFKIIIRHTIRNAIIPVITYLGPLSAILLTGTFVIEVIFNIPGLGSDFVESVSNNDYTLLSGLTIFYGTFLILSSVVVDILYGIVDPRISLEGGER